jgi:hypothetical protein
MRVISIFALAALGLQLGGCTAHTMPAPRDYNRLALVQPPTFNPKMLTEAERQPITTMALAERDYDNIEPAAGAVESLEFYGPYAHEAMLPAAPACRLGTNFAQGEALAYDWGSGHVGFGFGGSSVRSSEITGGALLKLSFNLDTPKKKQRSCDHGAAWDNFKKDLFE